MLKMGVVKFINVASLKMEANMYHNLNKPPLNSNPAKFIIVHLDMFRYRAKMTTLFVPDTDYRHGQIQLQTQIPN